VPYLVHLEGGEDGLDEDRGLDAAAREAHAVLREVEDVVPQARLVVVLQLGQIEERACIGRKY